MMIKQLCNEILMLIDDTLAAVTLNNPLHIEDVFIIAKLRATLITLQCSIPEELATPENVTCLLSFLSERWYRIIQTDPNRSYPSAPRAPANVICRKLAKKLAEICGKNHYQILMPTINVTTYEISATELQDPTLGMHEFVLSDDCKRIIEVAPCLDFACDDGILKHTSLFNGQPRQLSKSEARRVKLHSRETKALHRATQDMVTVKNKGFSFGAALKRLSNSLREGGAHFGKGEELNAASNANEGIYYFSEWLQTLNAQDKEKLMACSAPGLQEKMEQIWGRLSRPQDTNYKQVIYCVGLMNGFIDRILEHNKWLFDYSLQIMRQRK